MSRTAFRLLAAVLIASSLSAGAIRAEPIIREAKSIDVVLCLDVSGSMQGLVASAKIKLWDIVNELARVQPTPNLRVALYSYGHTTYPANEGWVRKDIDLTTDLDEVYKKLNALTINGGEEYVARVSRAALKEQPWAKEKGALRLIFVCGNEPVDQDKEVSLSDVAAMAKSKDVIINTIYCNWGNAQAGEASGWSAFAREAGGKHAVIQHDEQRALIATPFDKELTTLNTSLNRTFLAYGGKAAQEKQSNQLRQDSNANQAGAQAFAGRVAAKGGALYRNADWCIVSRCIDDPSFDLTKVSEAELPEELKKLKPEERATHVKKLVEERKKIQNEIAEMSTKRAKFLAEEMKKHASSAEKELDEALKEMIREQGKAKGIDIPK